MKHEIIFAGRVLSEFNAKLESYPIITSCEIDAEVFQGLNRSAMQLLYNRRGVRKMSCTIDFYGEDSFLRTFAQSSFEALFLDDEPVEISFGDGFFYRAVLLEVSEPETIGNFLTSVTYEFQVTRHTERIVFQNDSKGHGRQRAIIHCISTIPRTDCVLFIPQDNFRDGRSVTISIGTEQWTTTPNLIKSDLILDGERKIFLSAGENVTHLIDWQDFPYLKPGDNTFEVAVNGVLAGNGDITVSYTPTYL